MEVHCFEYLADDEIKKRANSYQLKKNFKSNDMYILTTLTGRRQTTITDGDIGNIIKLLREEVFQYWIPYKKEFGYTLYKYQSPYTYKYYRYWVTLGKYKLYAELLFNRHEELTLKELGLGGYKCQKSLNLI